MVASDPHLSLQSPPVFYEVGLDVPGPPDKGLSLYGVTFPGTPALVHGTNGHVSWGSTVNPEDVTDVYSEQLVLSGGVPVATIYQGNAEPTQIIPETFRANQPADGTPDDLVVVPPAAGVPAATVVVPRRNQGPLISASGSTGLSVQYTGFGATREPDFFRLLSHATTVGEAIDALRYFDFGAQNWMFVDDRGNIGYKTSGEIPLREALQAGAGAGLQVLAERDLAAGLVADVAAVVDEHPVLGPEVEVAQRVDRLADRGCVGQQPKEVRLARRAEARVLDREACRAGRRDQRPLVPSRNDNGSRGHARGRRHDDEIVRRPVGGLVRAEGLGDDLRRLGVALVDRGDGNAAREHELLRVDVGDVLRIDRRAPRDVAVRAVHQRRGAGERDAVESQALGRRAGDVEADLVEDGGRLEREVRIVGDHRPSARRLRARDDPDVRALGRGGDRDAGRLGLRERLTRQRFRI